jgi:uridine phosphorylase
LAHEPRDEAGRMYHTGLSRSDVGRVAFLPGDPGRVSLIAERFSSRKQVRSHREYTSYSGRLGIEKVIAVSTGIGGPSAAIAIEELARLGVKVMIRVGSCGAISRTAPVGTVIIADSAVRLDGTTAQYVHAGYPASATPEVVMALKEGARKAGAKSLVGIAASTDSFFVGQGRKGFGGYFPTGANHLVSDLRMANVLCFEMEASTLFTLGRIYGIKTGAVLAVVGNRVTNEFRVSAGIDSAIDTATNAVRYFRRYSV